MCTGHFQFNFWFGGISFFLIRQQKENKKIKVIFSFADVSFLFIIFKNCRDYAIWTVFTNTKIILKQKANKKI